MWRTISIAIALVLPVVLIGIGCQPASQTDVGNGPGARPESGGGQTIVSSGGPPLMLGDVLLQIDMAARAEFEKEHPGVLPEGPLRARLPLPTARAFNWCDLNDDFYVYNQGSSNSCWADAAIEALECNWLMRNGTRLSLSPQVVLDYTQRPSGGSGTIAFDVLLKHGTAQATKYPFAGKPQTVRSDVHTPYRAVAHGIVGDGHKPPSVLQLKAALLQHGPLVISVFSTPAFREYSGGVFAEHFHPAEKEPPVNHDILLLGWDDSRGKGCWRIKNSWGTRWGERGYCWIEFESNNVCYDAEWVQAQSTYYALPKETFLAQIPDAEPPKVWTSPIAAVADIQSVRVEDNVTQEGRKGVVFHVTAAFGRARDKGASVTVFPEASDGTSPASPDPRYATPDGHLRARTTVVPPDDTSAFDDIALFLPYELLPKGQDSTWRFRADILCDGRWLCAKKEFRGEFKTPG